MKEIDVTWKMALHFWWAFFWRTLVFVYLPAFVLLFVVGIIAHILHMPPGAAGILGGVVGFSLGMLGCLWIIKKILKLKTKTFRITVVDV